MLSLHRCFSQFATYFLLLSRTKDRVSINHLLISLIFIHNKLLDASTNNTQEYALVYNCSSWALIADCPINPRTDLYRYCNYIGRFLHLCFRDSPCANNFCYRQCFLFWNFVTNLIWSQLALNLAFWMKIFFFFTYFFLPYFRWMDFA